jgi:hypothetical protein
LFVNAPLAFVSIFFNLLSFLIFKNLTQQKYCLKNHLKVYTLFSVFICILLLLSALCSAPRYLFFVSISYFGSKHSIKIPTFFFCKNFFSHFFIDPKRAKVSLNVESCLVWPQPFTTFWTWSIAFFYWNDWGNRVWIRKYFEIMGSVRWEEPTNSKITQK